MRRAVELSNIHHVILVLEHRCFVIVDIEVIGRAEDGHHTGESCRPGLAIHPITCILSLVCSNNREQIILLQEGTCRWIREEVGTAPNVVVDEILSCLLLAKLFQRVSPQNVAHKAMGRRLLEAVNLSKSAVKSKQGFTISYTFEVLECVQLGAQAPMYAEKLLVHDRGQWQGAKRVHASIVDLLGILMLALEFKREVIGQVATFMVAAQQPQGIGIPDLQRPQVQNALCKVSTLLTAGIHRIRPTSMLKYPLST